MWFFGAPGTGWKSKFAHSHYFGYWLLQQLALPCKPWFHHHHHHIFVYSVVVTRNSSHRDKNYTNFTKPKNGKRVHEKLCTQYGISAKLESTLAIRCKPNCSASRSSVTDPRFPAPPNLSPRNYKKGIEKPSAQITRGTWGMSNQKFRVGTSNANCTTPRFSKNTAPRIH